MELQSIGDHGVGGLVAGGGRSRGEDLGKRLPQNTYGLPGSRTNFACVDLILNRLLKVCTPEGSLGGGTHQTHANRLESFEKLN